MCVPDSFALRNPVHLVNNRPHVLYRLVKYELSTTQAELGSYELEL